MFRRLARIKQVIPEEECIEILKKEKRGVLSLLGDDDYPYGVPINHLYLEEDGCLYFHGAKKGHRIDAMMKHDKVSFCVFGEGESDETLEPFWALRFRSVIVFGRLEVVEDHERAVEIARQLSYKFTDDESYIDHEVKIFGQAAFCIRLRPEHICGKTVIEK